MERPSMQFYPGDWLHDPALRMCSLAARGLWIDMMCFMHQATPYGHLKVGTKVILPDNLPRMVGSTFDEVGGLLLELEEAGVFSRDDSGCIYSRRMVRDEQVRKARAAGGVRGGNPLLKLPKEQRERITSKVNLQANLELTPSSSSSSSSSPMNTETHAPAEAAAVAEPRARPPAKSKREPDEIGQAANRVVQHLDTQLRLHKATGVSNFPTANRIVRNYLEGKGTCPKLTEAQLITVIDWAMDRPDQRKWLASRGVAALAGAYGAWLERDSRPAAQGQRNSNVFLKRDRHDDSYYDYITNKLDGGGSGDGPGAS